MSKTTRREFLKIGLAAAGGALAASGLEIPLFGGNTSSLQNQITNLNKHISTVTGFLTLSIPEQQLLEPVVETIIPSDSTGPGAKEAGVIYFIDRQLASDYGQSGNMFMDAPHIPPNIPASSANQLQVLKDLWSNAPKTKTNPSPPADDLTGFSNIQASDFAYELTFMTWAGFTMDPIYGGNKDMVGWDYIGFNGVNFGNFYGEGLSQKTLMVASSPTKIKPASLAQYQQQATGGT